MKPLFVLQNRVQHGQHRGRRLGFPTMNFPVAALPEGIYVSETTIDGKRYNSLTFIGQAKTYNETNFQAETYVFDFNRDVYGQTITVNLLKKIRENQKFVSEEVLLKQMEEDKKQALSYFHRQ